MLLGDLALLVVPNHHGHRRADDVTHHLRHLSVAELLRRLNVPERQPLWEIKQDGEGTDLFFFFPRLDALGADNLLHV